ncbi:MAG: hypothetical protein ABI896_00150 [Actinomycetota bacterium]
MGLGDLWKRLTGGDRAERIEEQRRDEGAEEPVPVEDYEGMKDDVALDERFRGAGPVDGDE